MSIFCTVSDIFNVERVLEIWVRGPSRSLEMTPFIDDIRVLIRFPL